MNKKTKLEREKEKGEGRGVVESRFYSPVNAKTKLGKPSPFGRCLSGYVKGCSLVPRYGTRRTGFRKAWSVTLPPPPE